MNRPYLSVEAILEQFRSGAEVPSGEPAPARCLQRLAEFLAREYATMNADDWDALVHVGMLLWRKEEVWDETARIH